MDMPDVDWDVVEKAIQKQTPRGRPDGKGWFSVRDYCERSSLSRRWAAKRLKRAADKGDLDVMRVGQQLFYRLPI